LVVLGRVDRVIISGGEKIDPLYIEEVVMKRLAAIGRQHRCLVLGFPHPKWGERPVLFVEQGLGMTSDSPAGSIEILASVQEIVGHHLPPLLRPEVIITVPGFPVTGLGKIASGELRAAYLERVLQEIQLKSG
jgi:fatty-acyl-CoA synthase